jgi:hypothetical protein
LKFWLLTSKLRERCAPERRIFAIDKASPAIQTFFPIFMFLVITFTSLLTADRARAVPSFARQTGFACSQCHYHSFGPALTSLGRQFKLNGYVWGKPNVVPPIAAMAQGSFTNTHEGQPGGAAPDFGNNNNVALDQASLFYGGRIWSKFGALAQGTYDGIGKQVAIDNTDIRFANRGTLGGSSIVYGISVNNNPTAQDLWNTTPAWGFPYFSSSLAPTPSASTLIDGGLAQEVAGATVYTMWKDLLYLEVGPYATLPAGVQESLGIEPDGEDRIKGVAPYWRAVLQRQWKGSYISGGTFGLLSWVYPGRVKSKGTDRYADIGFDLSYQYLGFGRHLIGLDATFIKEFENLSASKALGNSQNSSDSLETFNAHAYYTFAETYGVTFGYFQTTGTTDKGLYQPGSVSGSANGSPDSKGFIAQLDYIPFGKPNSFRAPFLNLRFSLQYVGYFEFNGSSSNYNGFGRNASDNNTLYLLIWWAF